MSQTSTKKTADKKQKLLTIIGSVLCLILLPILIINITLIAKSYIHEDEVPAIGGVFPMIVLTDSMYPEIAAGDLIICNTVEAEDVQVEDVISFYDPMGNGTAVVTISAETLDLTVHLEELLRMIRKVPGVIKAEVLAG